MPGMRAATGRRGAALLAAALAATLAVAASAQAPRAFDLQGHRGARGLAPENTLAAFAKALEIGVTTIETDLAVTREGVLVIAHDPSLNPDLVRGPDGQWLAAKGPPIRTLTLPELRLYDVGRINPASRYAQNWPEQVAADGQRFPTLGELFRLVRQSGKTVRFNLETKISPDHPDETLAPATFAWLLVEALRTEQMTRRVTVQSFDWRTLIETRRLAPEIETACLSIESSGMDTVRRGRGPSPWAGGLDLAATGGSVPKLAKAAGCAIWSPFWRNLTPEAYAEAREAGLKVLPWTVNDPAEMARLIDLGVDGIITDYPDRLRKAMAAKGLALP